jgi:hypothetical protein
MPITLDDENRLVLSRSAVERLSLPSPGRKNSLAGDGSGKTRGNGKVTAKLTEYSDGTVIPDKVILDGKWRLNENHDLEFSVRGYSNWLPKTTLTFKTGIISAKANELVFSARISDGKSGIFGCALAFSGKWQADKNNRLTFEITKYSGRSDRLVFQGAWQIGKKNELFYSYETEKLKRTGKEEFSFGLKGRWALSSKRIVYKLGSSTTNNQLSGPTSVLSFSAALETPSIAAKEGEIRYTVGVRFTSGGKEKKLIRSIAIYGTWKLGKDLSVGFEAETTVRGKNLITFSAEKAVFKGGTLKLALKTEDGKKFGAEVEFAKSFTEDAELFALLSRFAGETRVFGGVRVKF